MAAGSVGTEVQTSRIGGATDLHACLVVDGRLRGAFVSAVKRILGTSRPAYRGRCVSFGDAGRRHGTPIDVSTLRQGNRTLVGYFLGAELVFGDRARELIARHPDDVAAGALRVVIDRTFPLREAAEGMPPSSRRACGRVLLEP